MLDLDKKEKQYDVFKTSYCSLLERWKVNTKIAEIQKHVNVSSQPEFLGKMCSPVMFKFDGTVRLK